MIRVIYSDSLLHEASDRSGASVCSGSKRWLILLRLLSCAVAADALAILCLSAYCLLIDLWSREVDIFQLSFRLYGLALYTIAALCEIDRCECLRTIHLLQHWTWRGLFHIFLGLLSMNEYMQMKIAAIRVVGYLGALLIAMGILYIVLVRHRCC